jgi:hypothetical protein
MPRRHVSIAVSSFVLSCGSPPAPTTPPKPSPSPGPISNVAPAPPRPAPLTGSLPVGSGDYGTAHPLFIRAVDESERWVAMCQARKDTDGDGKIEVHVGHHGALFGDGMQLYLALGGGPGVEIEALVGRSRDDRWLAVLRDKKLWLVDGQTGAQSELAGADTESDRRPGAPHRAAIFSGNRLLYVRHRAGGDTLVIHDLATHAERAVDVPDRIWRMIPEPDGLAQVVTVPQGQGFPQLMTSLDAGECLGPPMSYSTGGQSGPTPVFDYYDLDAGKKLAKPDGTVATIGKVFVRAPKDGALYLDNDQIAPPTCSPQVLAVMPSPPRVIAICGAKKQAKVLLLGKGLSKEMATIDREKNRYKYYDQPLTPSSSVVCDNGLHCVATATNDIVDLKGGSARYIWGSRLYVSPATGTRTPEIIDVATGTRTPSKGTHNRLAAGKFIVDYNDRLIDLETNTDLGNVTGALRVGTSGRVLREAGKRGEGPLRWASL